MQHINLMLHWALLCLLMAGSHGLAVAEQLEPDVVAAREALETDPVLVAQTEQYELAFEAWREELICHLLQPWQAPLVRLRAVNARVSAVSPPLKERLNYTAHREQNPQQATMSGARCCGMAGTRPTL